MCRVSSVEDHCNTTLELLKELQAINKPVITIYNKMDMLEDQVVKARLRAMRPDAVFTSIKDRAGIEELKAKLIKQITKGVNRVDICIPAGNYEIPALAYKSGKVLSIKYESDYTYITARIADNKIKPFKNYIVSNALQSA